MKKIRLFVTLTLGLSLSLALLWVLGIQITSATATPGVGNVEVPGVPVAELHVCPTECTFSSVQAAVDAASNGDTIKVADGTYTDMNNYGGLSQIVYISKTLTIQGGYTTTNWTTPKPSINHTTLDAQGQGRVIYITGDIQPIIEGFRITGGEAEGLGSVPGDELWDGGGGVYVITATAMIRNNQVFNNSCSSQFCGAGGMQLVSSDATVSGNVFFLNYATWDGGGLQTFFSDATVSGNVFKHNSVGLSGGGAYLHMSTVTFSGNIVISNTAKFGGGLVSSIGTDMIVNNVIVDNHVSTAGGGLWVYGSSPHLLHNTIARNSGGDGSGIYVSQVEYIGPFTSNATLANTILVSHAVGIRVEGGNTLMADSVLWYDTPITISQSITAVATVLNQHTGDPTFGPDGYHLMAGSAAIDKGIEAGITSDIDGEPRPASAGYDLGADELWHKIYLPLVGGSGHIAFNSRR